MVQLPSHREHKTGARCRDVLEIQRKKKSVLTFANPTVQEVRQKLKTDAVNKRSRMRISGLDNLVGSGALSEPANRREVDWRRRYQVQRGHVQ